MAVNEVCNLPVSHSLSCLFRFSSCVCLGARLQGLLCGANFSSSLSKKLFLLMETNSRMWAWGTVVSAVLYVGQKSPGSPLDLWHLQLHPVAFQFPNKPFCSRSKSWNPSGLCCAVQLLWSLTFDFRLGFHYESKSSNSWVRGRMASGRLSSAGKASTEVSSPVHFMLNPDVKKKLE